MGKPIVKVTDIYTNPTMQGGTAPIACPGSTSLLIGSLPALQVTDAITPIPDMALPGTTTVLHNGLPLNTMGEQTSQGGVLLTGTMTVLIG
ncbi:PAAR domain-containing protein [Aquimarina longa]|uniref:PAAR domain-containing protein n=1 Tax=Aquimarina longa TaxID=1080221 RepID=UPI000784CFA4|nr:PAAR domain-containing protein [Aquimarina longa]